MDIALFLIDFILHIDKHLTEFVEAYGTLVYALLFLIVFVETGLVVMPFLPGDSLLFMVGTLAATGRLMASAAASVPTMNSSESPGRKGITTRPVSTNTIRKSSA